MSSPRADPSMKCPRCKVTVPCIAIDARDRCAADCPLNRLPLAFLHPGEYARLKASGEGFAGRIKIVEPIAP